MGGQGAKTGLYLVVGGTQKNAFVGNGSYSPCLTSSMGTGGGHVPLIVGNINPCGHGHSGNVFNTEGLAPTITTGKGEGPKIIIDKKISNCITANYNKGTDLKGYFEKSRKQLVTDCTLRIRRLTPKECFRLMGFSDEAFEKAKTALNNTFYKGKDRSNSQLYKMAGNSIVVDVPEGVFKNLFREGVVE